MRLKHTANRAVVDGKRIVLIDDFDRARHDLGEDRADDARRRRHARCISASPRRRSRIPDYYGIDTPERDKLLAATHDLEGMRQFIGADSLAFLSVEGIYRAMGYEQRDPVRPQFTDHCFTGDYPTPLTDQTGAGSVAAADCRCSPKRADAAALFRQCAQTRLSHAQCHRPLADRIALVTGASRGIGYATALALAKAGAHVVALARTVGGLEELDDAIKAAGGSATLVPLDLKDYAASTGSALP